LIPICAPGPVRHMSVRLPGRTGETADRHGQRPCKPATSTFTRLLAWVWACQRGRQAVMITSCKPRGKRFVLIARTEITNRVLIFRGRRLRSILAEYEALYTRRRLHRSRQPPPPRPDHLIADPSRNGSSADPPSAASSTNASGLGRSPSRRPWPDLAPHRPGLSLDRRRRDDLGLPGSRKRFRPEGRRVRQQLRLAG